MKTLDQLPFAPGTKKQIQILFSFVKEMYEKHYFIEPALIMFTGESKQIVFPINDALLEDRDFLKKSMRSAAQETNAHMTIFVSESYILTLATSEDRARFVGKVKDHPEKQEAILFNIESHTSSWAGRAKVTKREMQEVEFYCEPPSGFFTGILPKIKTN